MFQEGLRHEPYCLEAVSDERTVGLLPLAFVRSRLFGRFLVSLPYLNTGGVLATKDSVRVALVDRAVQLADALDVRYLELRHEERLAHPALRHELTSKAHLRLVLPPSADELWGSVGPKVRNQVRKGEKGGLTVHWGAADLLGQFYRVFAENMRDLGTPVFSRRLFRSILRQFPGQAELCVTRLEGRPVAAALLVHGAGLTEVPSASSCAGSTRPTPTCSCTGTSCVEPSSEARRSSILAGARLIATRSASNASGVPSPTQPYGSTMCDLVP